MKRVTKLGKWLITGNRELPEIMNEEVKKDPYIKEICERYKKVPDYLNRLSDSEHRVKLVRLCSKCDNDGEMVFIGMNPDNWLYEHECSDCPHTEFHNVIYYSDRWSFMFKDWEFTKIK